MIAALIEAAEGLAVVGVGCFLAVETAGGLASDAEIGAILAVLGVLVGAGLMAAARGLHRRRRWSRTPSVLTQGLAVIVAISLIRAGQSAAGIPLVIVAVGCLVALFSPVTTRELYTSGEAPVRSRDTGSPAKPASSQRAKKP
ncbi:MAG: hypothetical protein ACRDN9_07485 [Streptosporangiaceae bacterium]